MLLNGSSYNTKIYLLFQQYLSIFNNFNESYGNTVLDISINYHMSHGIQRLETVSGI